MTTRSAKLAVAAPDPPGPVEVFTAQPGTTVILKTVNATAYMAGTTTIEVSVVSAPSGNGVFVLSQPLEANTPYQWEGWIILDPDDHIDVRVSQGAVVVWISGTLLPETVPPV